VDIGDTIGCEHRKNAKIRWVNNDKMSAPVILIESCEVPAVVTLTNQVFRVNCPVCFETIRRDLTKYSLGRSPWPPHC